MRGIILAGGSGTRLHPMTLATSKQLLPVYDKPMIYYPLTVLMLAGVREILIISTPEDLPSFKRLLGSGAQWGLSLSYAEQPRPEGLAQAYMIGAPFVEGHNSVLMLGDNIFYGHGLTESLTIAADEPTAPRSSPIMCAIRSVTASSNSTPTAARSALEEKPTAPKSNWAVTGLYFYDRRAPEYRRNAQALAARRTGDHRSQRRLSRSWQAECRTSGTWLRLARHGHAGVASRGGAICSGDRAAAGTTRRLSRGNRLPAGLDRRSRHARGRGAPREERLRRLSPSTPARG